VPPLPDPKGVFLNIPYDQEFSSLYVAYIVGLCQLGMLPHLASEIPGGDRRLDKIFKLIQRCRYSIHDLSRVEVSVAPAAVPRFNMPVELGMTITWQKLYPNRHNWLVWESEPYRIQRSARDLNGTDPYIHGGTAEGVLRELRNAFPREKIPSVPDILVVYRFVNNQLIAILSKHGISSPYSRSVFIELCWLSKLLADSFHYTEPAV
jgi:hypothetical protein